MVDLGIKHGPFDIIIEDGAHMREHQATTLRTLYPVVRQGGMYVVENLQTDYGGVGAVYRGVATSSCMDLLKQLVDLRVAGRQLDIGAVEDSFLRTYARSMNLTFTGHACVIQKLASLPKRALTPLIVPESVPGQPVAVGIVAHVGYTGDVAGDVAGDEGWITRPSGPGNIQGFRLSVEGGAALDLVYRARRSNGIWTDWVEAGLFAGSAGIEDDLTGFAVLLGPLPCHVADRDVGEGDGVVDAGAAGEREEVGGEFRDRKLQEGDGFRAAVGEAEFDAIVGAEFEVGDGGGVFCEEGEEVVE